MYGANSQKVKVKASAYSSNAKVISISSALYDNSWIYLLNRSIIGLIKILANGGRKIQFTKCIVFFLHFKILL